MNTRFVLPLRIAGLGVAGINYVIEASTNLSNWLPVSTNTADSGGLFTFTQTNASQFPQRYFRAVTP